MTLPMMNFPILSFQQANPGLTAADSINKTLGQILQNHEQQIKNQYAPQTFQEALAKAHMENQIMQPQVQYAGRNALADTQYNEQRAPYMNAQLREILEGKIPHEQAESRYLGEQTATLPEKTKAELISAQARQGMAGYYNSPSTKLARILQTPQLLSLIGTNKKVAQNVAQALADTTTQAADLGNQYNSQSPLLQDMTENQGPIEGKVADVPMTGPQLNAYNKVSPTLNDIQQQGKNSRVTLSPNDYEQLSKSVNDVLEKKTTTAQIMNQRQYAGILDNLFDQGSELMPSVVKYAGLAGAGKKGIDALQSSFGKQSKTYQDYLLFSRSLAPILSNEMRRTLGGQASDNEQKIMANLANPSWIDSNPDQALSQYQFLSNVYRNKVNPSLAARPSETLSLLKGGEAKSMSQDNESKIQRYMQKYPGRSREQIITAIQRGK